MVKGHGLGGFGQHRELNWCPSGDSDVSLAGTQVGEGGGRWTKCFGITGLRHCYTAWQSGARHC